MEDDDHEEKEIMHSLEEIFRLRDDYCAAELSIKPELSWGHRHLNLQWGQRTKWLVCC